MYLGVVEVCTENHRESVRLRRQLDKLSVDRKKTMASMDYVQRQFIVRQIFDKQLHPFYNSCFRPSMTEVESEIVRDEETQQSGSKNNRDKQGLNAMSSRTGNDVIGKIRKAHKLCDLGR